MLKINCDYKIKSDIEFILESEHINILDLSIRTKISRATLDDIMSNKVVRNEIYEKLYSYIYKSNYRLNKTKEEILKEKTQKQKERFIMFYNLDKNNNEEYTLSKLAKYNNCTSSAVKFSITSVASKLANLKDDRKYIIVQNYEQCIAKQNN